eukprot:scaffold1618_cov397-Prasinococcus_capsulatus_cf.AAC.23
MASMRSLLRTCSTLLAAKEERDEEVARLSILIAMAGKYFRQDELHSLFCHVAPMTHKLHLGPETEMMLCSVSERELSQAARAYALPQGLRSHLARHN